MSAASQYDNDLACGAATNASKYLAAEADFHACETAVMTHSGFSYVKKHHVALYTQIADTTNSTCSPTISLMLYCKKSTALARTILNS
jgi:acyl-CoA dehydrogenase